MTWGNLAYKVYPAASYGNAKAQCEADGSFLAIPRSQAEFQDLKPFFTSLFTNEYIWIGINDIEQEGSFVGVDGSEISWTNWWSGQPNGGTNENGVAISGFSSDNGRWYDFAVNNQFKFVCSKYIEGNIFPI